MQGQLTISSCDVLTNTVLAPVVNIHSIPGASTFFVEHRHSYVDHVGNTYLKPSFLVWL